MENKEYETYEDIHAALSEAMLEASMTDEAGPYRSPSDDLSFLYENKEEQKSPKIRFSRFGKVAAIVIAVLLGMNVVMLATDSGECYSEKGLLHRIYEGARGIFTDEDGSKYVTGDDKFVTYEFNSIEQFVDAKEIWNDLYIPGYIPDYYILYNLKIVCDNQENYSAKYVFCYGEENLIIQLFMYDDKKGRNSSDNNGQLFTFNDRVINLYYDDYYKNNVIDIYLDDIMICVYGNLEIDELLKIGENMKK